MTDTWKDVEETLRAALAEAQREATKAKADAERHVRDTIEAERRVDEVMNAVRAASGGGDIKSMEETIRAAGAKIEDLDARVFMLEAERDDARRERDDARKWLAGICAEFEGAVAHADWRAAGSKGMSVPFTGDFASVVQLPGAINRMRWWARVFRAALNGEQP